MNVNEDYKYRQIIPRWYPFNIAFHMGEIQSIKESPAHIWTPASYKLKEEEWLLYKELPYAIDFVGTALVSNDYTNKSAVEASKFILENYEKVSPLAKELAEKFMQLPEATPGYNLSTAESHIRTITELKKHVRAYLYNSIAWVDMAFYYTVLGQNEKAGYCISIALNLAPENRFILRSAARFYVHLNDPDKALFFLRKANLTRNDPWLLASEISISQAFDLRTSNIKIAKNILSVSDASPRDLTELFGTIGTLEAKNGGNKKAKKLFREALIDPNENTVAQTEWVSSTIGFTIKLTQNVEAAFEADAKHFFRNEEYSKALEAALKWLRYQPFSSRPAQIATYIAGVCLNDYEEVLRIVEKEARRLLDKDFGLKNNYIFSLASLNRGNDAKLQLATVEYGSLTEKEQATYYATKGLIKFRAGEIEEGRLLYEEAIQRFRRLEEERGVALAIFYWAREEKIIMHDVTKMIDKVVRLAKKLGLKELLHDEMLGGKKAIGR